MLILIGLGLVDEYDMSLRGIDAAKKSDKIYCELYTGKWEGNIENLEKILGKQVFFLRRIDLEEGSRKILDEATTRNIVIFTQGDPMVATTHSSLLIEARKMGIETKIIHNSSIFSAISETGLHVYKFGATTTIPFLEKTGGKLSKSVYETIKNNKILGLHTLCLLDISADATTFMSPTNAMEMLLAMERQFGEGVIEPYQKLVVFCKAGSAAKIFYDQIEILQAKNIIETPAVLVIPGKLHFTEEDFLQKFANVSVI